MSASISQKIMYSAIIYAAAGFSLVSSAIALLVSTIQFKSQLNQPTTDLLQIIREIIVPNYLLTVGLYFGVVWLISLFSPWAVRKLCNDRGCSNHLVGFEGTMSLHDLEKTIYGNFNNRLSYTASSTVFSGEKRDRNIRICREPDKNYWKNRFQELGLPETHRIFIIVDTGDMTVSVISAERPPVVALISGREGGMLRVLLCSWRFENNCLYREGVVRMRTSLENQATRNDWLKISLASQGDANRTRSGHLKQKQSSTSTSTSTSTSSPLRL